METIPSWLMAAVDAAGLATACNDADWDAIADSTPLHAEPERSSPPALN